MEGFAKELKAYRKKRGWTIPQMAMLTNISPSTIASWECKNRIPVYYAQSAYFCWFDTLGLPDKKDGE